VRWSILVPHIPHRDRQFRRLLHILEPQIGPQEAAEVEVLVDYDNLERSYGQKLQRLLQASGAEYISSLSDDDSVAPDFIPRILEAMAQGPDQVGFRVRYTQDGVLMTPVIHSLRYSGWVNTPELIWRDHMYYSPVRRALANQVRFLPERAQGHDVDRQWASDLRQLGIVQSEVFIDAELHHYDFSPADSFRSPRSPWVGPLPPLPAYPWLRQI
jgi:hypothetical protein